ncbi:MAG TPA: hypothetical protein VIO15_05755 [Bacteroidales bacterium]
MKKIPLFFIAFIMFAFAACDEPDDLSGLKTEHQYQGTWAFPLGNTYLNLKIMGINMPEAWKEHPEYLQIPDTIYMGDNVPIDIFKFDQNNKYIKSLTLRIFSSNQFPANAALFVTLDTSNNQSTLGSSFLSKIDIDAAQYNEDLTIKEEAKNRTDITLDKQQIDSWLKAQYIHLYCAVNNQIKKNEQYKYYETYKVNLYIAVIIEFDYLISE